jgi:N-acetylglucosamine transport system permease protein
VFYLSLTHWRGFSPPVWARIDNCRALLHDENLWKALRHHAVLLLAFPTATLLIALLFAFWLNVRPGGGSALRSGAPVARFDKLVFFFPQLLAVPIVAVLFQTVYRPDAGGLVNGVLDEFGAARWAFSSTPDLALWSIIAVLVWQAIGLLEPGRRRRYPAGVAAVRSFVSRLRRSFMPAAPRRVWMSVST